MRIRTIGQHLAIAATLPLWFSACTTQQQQQRPAPVAAAPAAPKAAEPVRTTGDYGPSYTTYEEGGAKYTKGSMAFPTGLRSSSGLLLEKVVPSEVAAGQPFEYVYNVINLTDYKLHQVSVTDEVSNNFKPTQADPRPAKMDGNLAQWSLDELGPKEKKVIRVKGSASQEGTITTCGWATYSPILCEPIKVVRPALQLTKRAPAEVILCDPIPMTLTVRNTGSSVLTAVRVTDALPDGLTSSGQRNLSFDAGTLAPGASRDFTFNATASKTGRFVNTAKATSAQGVEGEASATTVVRQPVLTLACNAPEERFIGRPFDVCFTVANKGDTVSANTVVEVTLPAGVTVNSSTAGGSATGGKVTWNVGSLAPNASKEVCTTLTASAPATLQFAASSKGTCATEVTSNCRTRVIGIPAILLEVVDLEDPIEVGKDVTYVIDVTNQGSAPGTNIKLVCTLEDSQSFVSGSGATAVSGAGKTITMGALPSLAPKQKATWRVVIKAGKADNVRFKTSMTSDQLTRPVEETESTNQY
jgi:uncharacterized repeat protein (TIGR01451 family)